VTKEAVKEVRKRKRREETAEARGKPLKAAREQKNRQWEAVYKQQAIALFNAKFSSGPKPDYASCRNELLKLPGFDGVTSANIQGWLLAESRMATQQPNELGLIVAAAGRKPTLPSEMYAELADHIKKLAKARAFTMNATTMRPLVLAFITSKLGAPSVWSRPGHGGFVASKEWLRKLTQTAGLSWRKPYGDARKAPPDAAELIRDLILRLAYLMHEFDIPPCLVLNFDHTGLHLCRCEGTLGLLSRRTPRLFTTRGSTKARRSSSRMWATSDRRQARLVPPWQGMFFRGS
jgi:hypothetical protein